MARFRCLAAISVLVASCVSNGSIINVKDGLAAISVLVASCVSNGSIINVKDG
jgi:hypothetical protein